MKVHKLLTLFICLISVNVLGTTPTEIKLAIPSFINLNQDVSYDWYNEALSDMITTDISKSPQVTVVARNELKQILEEQELSLSGVIDDNDRIEVGNISGANMIVYGSYTVINNLIRIDTKIFSIEEGVVQAANSIEGNTSDIFTLEKTLALEIMESLGVELGPQEIINVMEMPTTNTQAAKENYRGVMALDADDYENAKLLFQNAIENDSTYLEAQKNFEAVSELNVSGDALFVDFSTELNNKNQQLVLLKQIVSNFKAKYWNIKIIGEPDVTTENNNDQSGRISVPVEITVNPNATAEYINDLKSISYGTKIILFKVNDTVTTICLHPDNYIWLKETSWVEQVGRWPNCWYNSKLSLNVMVGEEVIRDFPFSVYSQLDPFYNDPMKALEAEDRGNSNLMPKLDNPRIVLSVGGSVYTNQATTNPYSNKSLIPLKITLSFPEIEIEDIRRITKLEIIPEVEDIIQVQEDSKFKKWFNSL